MKNTYAALSACALGLTIAGGVSAQSHRTVANVSRQTLYDIKKHDAALHAAAPVGMRGGGLPNDECDFATVLAVGTECVPVSGTMVGATQSLAPSTCSTFTSSAANDQWFSFVATASVTLIEVTGGGDATTGIDAVLEAYTAPCVDLASLGCVDATVRGETEMLTLVTTPGNTYFYRTYYWIYTAEQTVFDFTTCVYSPTNIPANDDCSGAVAQALSVGSTVTFTGDNTGALDTEGLGIASVWESFTTTECSFITMDYCGTTPAFANAFLSLFIGCPYTGFIPDVSFETTTCPDGNFTIQYEYVPAGTYYYAVLTEDGSVGPYSINVTAAACPPGYCPASADLCDEYIAEVMIGTIDNATDCAVGPAVDYTAISTNIAQGASLPITVLNGPAIYPEDQVVVWVDWNNNESFGEAGETFPLDSAGLGATFTGAITAPIDAVLGPVRMRIRMMYTGSPSPCGGSAYGEVEDYTLNVDQFNAVATLAVNTFSVFPNPTDGDLTVRASTPMNAVAQVLDVTGRLLHTERMVGLQADLALAGKLVPGAYLLRLSDADGSSEYPFVVR
ncbi:MAG: GEVED domain-containing protein [Flavobacteriales bacterium]